MNQNEAFPDSSRPVIMGDSQLSCQFRTNDTVDRALNTRTLNEDAEGRVQTHRKDVRQFQNTLIADKLFVGYSPIYKGRRNDPLVPQKEPRNKVLRDRCCCIMLQGSSV